jgi:predicted permease
MGRVSGFRPLIVDGGEPERLTVANATDDFLDAYGVKPILGRSIQREDTRDGAPGVALLGESYWRSRFSADHAVLGRVIRVQDKPVTIVGVLPAKFFRETKVWIVSSDRELQMRGSGTPVVGRLRAGVSLTEAANLLSMLSKDIPGFPGQPAEGLPKIELRPMYEYETGGYRDTIRILAGAVGLILLIACVNVAGLLIARGATREAELAVRASIGASRVRLIRQLLTESLVLALTGAVVGTVGAWVALDALVAILPFNLPENSPATINLVVLACTLSLSVASALIFGLVPALTLSRVRVGTHLVKAGRRAGGPLSRRGGQWLIAVQVGLALVLLAGAGLMVRSFARLVSVDLGFDPASIVAVEVEPVEQTAAARVRYYPALLQALKAMPDIAEAGALDDSTMRGGGTMTPLQSDSGVPAAGSTKLILPGLFETLGVRPVFGRLPVFGREEEEAVINEEAARAYERQSPIGDGITQQVGRGGSRHVRIVGVVPTLRHRGPQGRIDPAFYLPPNPAYSPPMSIVLRFRPGASVAPDELRRVATTIGPKVLIGRIGPVSDYLERQVSTPRHRMQLLALLGAFGLLLTLVGIFSMTSYAVSRRTREIGIRMAFGARPADVVRRVVSDAAWPVAFGLAGGVTAAWYATELIRTFLFQTPPRDPATLFVVAAGLGVVACVAAWIPARRAAHVDPVAALRAD